MRIKILLVGNDPAALFTDGQLLKEKGMMVFTGFNLQNIQEMISEVKPDIIFFDPHKQSVEITDCYNEIVNSIYFTSIPVIYTLADDDIYLVTRKRTEQKEKRTLIADTITDAVKMALLSSKTHHKKISIPAKHSITLQTVYAR
jgi:response regulator RpfG family c-di-GMP phosphodiesterase